MECPKCKSKKFKTIDVRNSGPEDSIYRRRECLKCGERWTTYEIYSKYITFEASYKHKD